MLWSMRSAAFVVTDTLARRDIMPSHELDSVQVWGHRITAPFTGTVSHTLRWNTDFMNILPKIMGNADPVHYAQFLPGIQTCNEYDSGLYIQGCDPSQNYVTISGAPIYNVQHLLGFFSIFNASHFSDVAFTTSRHSASFPNRLGGELDMELPDSLPVRANGEVTFGVMSSQGTVRLPVSSHSALFVSARAAYLDLLYGRWLNVEGSRMRYFFDDYNVTWLSRFAGDDFRLNAYLGKDHVKITDTGYQSDFSLKWGNTLLSADWDHRRRGIQIHTTAYYTRYHNGLDIMQEEQYFKLPSSTGELGLKSSLSSGGLKAGVEMALRAVLPQSPERKSSFRIGQPVQETEHTREYSAFVDYTHEILIPEMTVEGGVRASVYRSFDYILFGSVDPLLTLNFQTSGYSTLSFSCGTQHQYISQTGFSSIGLPTDFWYSACSAHRPQYSYDVSAAYDVGFDSERYHLITELFYKRLFRQEEYVGNMMDMLTDTYRFDDQLEEGKGYNAGFNLMLSKRRGAITGWLSYAYGRSRRRFDGGGLQGWYPTNHERPHEFNAVATWHYRRWDFGSTLVFASGTPFTSVKSFYLVNNHIISQFNRYNGDRLSPYFRWDVSVNYYFRNTSRRKSAVNLSLYNLTMHRNDLFYRFKIYNGRYAYKALHFILHVMPSISYYIKF
jgi:hypothetical protein